MFIAFLLCLTLTGVYATWLYAGVKTDIADVEQIMQVAMEDYDFEGAAGTFYVTSNMTVKVDQDTNYTDHRAKLVYSTTDNAEPYLQIVFEPHDNASDDVKKNAVNAELYLALSSAMKFKVNDEGHYDGVNGTDTDIFKLYNYADTVFTPNITVTGKDQSDQDCWKWTKQSDGTFTCRIEGDALRNMILLNATFKLDTKSDYDAFNNILLGGKILAKVTDGTVNSATGG
jgi:hypothetical protein